MASPADFALIRLEDRHEEWGRVHLRDMRPDDQNPVAWVGFAAEAAIVDASRGDLVHADTLAYDLTHARSRARVEVKTRPRTRGWSDPARFDYVNVPTHDGRAPIKAVDLVLFCWWTADLPRQLWILGSVLGPAEFERRAQFYREGAPMPHGGYARTGGEWAIEVKDMRPLPRGLFQEVDR